MLKSILCTTTAFGAIVIKSALEKYSCYALGDLGTVDAKPRTDSWNNDWRCRQNYTHHILLLRHGQYKPPNRGDSLLNATGRIQAQIAGRTLKTMLEDYLTDENWKVQTFVSSMIRANDTYARALRDTVEPCIQPIVTDDLMECYPCTYSPLLGNYGVGMEPDSDGVDKAFDDIFCQNLEKDTISVIVAHANVNRYLTLKALQLPTDALLRLELAHCSLVWLTIMPDSKVICQNFAVSNYFPKQNLSY